MGLRRTSSRNSPSPEDLVLMIPFRYSDVFKPTENRLHSMRAGESIVIPKDRGWDYSDHQGLYVEPPQSLTYRVAVRVIPESSSGKIPVMALNQATSCAQDRSTQHRGSGHQQPSRAAVVVFIRYPSICDVRLLPACHLVERDLAVIRTCRLRYTVDMTFHCRVFCESA